MEAFPPDRDLVLRALRADATAFDLIVDRHWEPVWRYAHSMLKGTAAAAAVAEEVTQETFLKAHHSLASLKDQSSLKAWLFTICRRCCFDCRRRPTVTTLDIAHPMLTLIAAEEHREQQHGTDLRSLLQEEVDNLCNDEREAFILVYVYGHSRDEAAEIVGVPASTMRGRANRARQRLAQRLCRIGAGER
jgi:RNA polymerase sigma-70 factor, ECF subfamily